MWKFKGRKVWALLTYVSHVTEHTKQAEDCQLPWLRQTASPYTSQQKGRREKECGPLIRPVLEQSHILKIYITAVNTLINRHRLPFLIAKISSLAEQLSLSVTIINSSRAGLATYSNVKKRPKSKHQKWGNSLNNRHSNALEMFVVVNVLIL